MHVRPAGLADAPAIAVIYNQGIEDRAANFETRLRTVDDIASSFNGVRPIMVAADDGKAVASTVSRACRRDAGLGATDHAVPGNLKKEPGLLSTWRKPNHLCLGRFRLPALTSERTPFGGLGIEPSARLGGFHPA